MNSVEKKGFIFELLDDGLGKVLSITVSVNGKEVGWCYVNNQGEFFGHDGLFATGFDDFEVEIFSQEVFDKEIENWVAEHK